MKRNTYRVVEYGGKHSGSVSQVPTSDELVLGREDLAYVLRALRRGNSKDRELSEEPSPMTSLVENSAVFREL